MRLLFKKTMKQICEVKYLMLALNVEIERVAWIHEIGV
jgi:hypothetical protein